MTTYLKINNEINDGIMCIMLNLKKMDIKMKKKEIYIEEKNFI